MSCSATCSGRVLVGRPLRRLVVLSSRSSPAPLALPGHLHRLDACRHGGRDAVASPLVRRPAQPAGNADPTHLRRVGAPPLRLAPTCSRPRCRRVASARSACCARYSGGCRLRSARVAGRRGRSRYSCRGSRDASRAARARRRRSGRTSWSSAIRVVRQGDAARPPLPERLHRDDDRELIAVVGCGPDVSRPVESREIDRAGGSSC